MKDGQVFQATLTTRGRRTGKPHSVPLRGVSYQDKIYFSRHKPDGDWFKNALAYSEVEITIDNETRKGFAREVKDQSLNQKISELKYPGEERAKDKRVAIEITLHESE